MTQASKQKPLPEKPKPSPVEETVARFQLSTEKLLEELRRETTQALADMRTQLGALADWRQSIDGQLRDARNDIKDHAHRMDQGLREANVALRVAVEQTNLAKDTLAVYERAREEAPDLSGAIENVARKQGQMEGWFDELRGNVSALSTRLEEATQGDFYGEEESEASEGSAITEAILKREEELRQPAATPRDGRA